jgi:hypothetical protein
LFRVSDMWATLIQRISAIPRVNGRSAFSVQRWTEAPRGGHFAAMEAPEILAEDMRVWFRQFRRDASSAISSKPLYLTIF